MPGFFNAMTQAVGSYLRNLKARATETVQVSFEDFTLSDSEPTENKPNFSDIVGESGMDDSQVENSMGRPMSNFIGDLTKSTENFFDPDDSRITNEPRGLRTTIKAVIGRVADFLPKSSKSKQSDESATAKKILGVLQKGLSVEKYRPEIVNGRIVGKHSKLYTLLSYLNEFIHPRDEAIDLLAYFRNSVDSEGKALNDTALNPSEVGIAAPTIVTALANALKNPNKMKEVLRGIADIGKVDRAKFLRIADQYLVEAKARMRAATEDLAAGRITVRQYRRTMLQEIKRTTIAQVILNIGGVGNLTDDVMKGIHQRIAKDVRGLDEFIREIKSRGKKEDDLFGTGQAGRPDDKGRAPDVDSEPLATITSSLAGISPEDGPTISDDSYVEDGIITAGDFVTAGGMAEGGYQEGQNAFRTLVADNANEYQLLEVRRLEESVENCEFCIGWADKPMPPGQLPDIGDPGCLGVRYNTGGCHCKMDTVTEDELEAAY